MTLVLAGAGTVSGLNVPAPGLVLIRKESFSGVASKPLDDVFTSLYKNYRVMLVINSTSASPQIHLRMRAAGVDESGAIYYYSNLRSSMNGGTVGSDYSTGVTNNAFYLGGSVSGTPLHFTGDVMSPKVAATTFIAGISADDHTGGVARMLSGFTTVATSFDGLTVKTDSGQTMTGDIYVYGYNETVGDSAAYDTPPASPVKAWAKFNVSGVLQASSGVSSVTDAGVGKWTVNLSPAMPDANYAVLITGQDGVGQEINYRVFACTASSFDVYAVNNGSGAYVDPEYVNVAVIR